MKTNIVRIGNSKGIRLPKAILEQCRLQDEIDLAVEDNCLVIRPARAPRSGWDEAFLKMAQQCDDQLLDADTAQPSVWDKIEWRW